MYQSPILDELGTFLMVVCFWDRAPVCKALLKLGSGAVEACVRPTQVLSLHLRML